MTTQPEVSSHVWRLGFPLVAVALLAAGCPFGSNDADACEGRFESIEGRSYCVHERSEVSGTEFACPDAFPNRRFFDDLIVCAKNDESIPEAHRDQIANNFGADAGTSGNEDGGTDDDHGIVSGKLDLLWVIDNSGSMCQEQRLLRDNFPKLVDQLQSSGIDFNIGVTTTHFDRRGASVEFEKIAEGGQLQSTPSPVPFPDRACQFASDTTGALKNASHPDGPDFQPIKNAVRQAVQCAKGDYSSLLDGPEGDYPSTERVVCALYGPNPPSDIYSGGDPCQAADATKHDGRIHKNDLFPCGSQHDAGPTAKCPKRKMEEVYRDIPKVIRASDYTSGEGIDDEQLARDFACMSFVGTRGNGLEQGLRAAVKAVDPEMTGGPASEPVDPTAPNHGFIRRDADFATIFVTDENDCSFGDSWEEYMETASMNNGFRDNCGGTNCYFPTRNAEDQSPLENIDPLVERFTSNLAESKDVSRSRIRDAIAGEGEMTVAMASLDGGYEPYSGSPPEACGEDLSEHQPLRCQNAKGEIYTGDRYHDFIRRFARRYPTAQEGLGSRGSPATSGLLCRGDFGGVIESIAGEFFGSPF